MAVGERADGVVCYIRLVVSEGSHRVCLGSIRPEHLSPEFFAKQAIVGGKDGYYFEIIIKIIK
jgi:hypothetical protein